MVKEAVGDAIERLPNERSVRQVDSRCSKRRRKRRRGKERSLLVEPRQGKVEVSLGLGGLRSGGASGDWIVARAVTIEGLPVPAGRCCKSVLLPYCYCYCYFST